MRALAASLLLLLAGCAEDPLALAPFPCADDSTCPASLTCAAGTAADGSDLCLPECATSLDCEEGSLCAPVGDSRACLPGCTLFGTDCDGATTCRMQPDGADGYTTTCLAVSRGHELYAACESSLDCPGQASCVRASEGEPPSCRPQCDAAHPCHRRMTCEPLLPSGAGVCL